MRAKTETKTRMYFCHTSKTYEYKRPWTALPVSLRVTEWWWNYLETNLLSCCCSNVVKKLPHDSNWCLDYGIRQNQLPTESFFQWCVLSAVLYLMNCEFLVRVYGFCCSTDMVWAAWWAYQTNMPHKKPTCIIASLLHPAHNINRNLYKENSPSKSPLGNSLRIWIILIHYLMS